MTRTAPEQAGERVPLDSPAGVLEVVGAARMRVLRGEADVLLAACAWADLHPVVPGDPGATLVERWGDTDLRVAGPGAPAVEEFSIPAFAARLGLRCEAGVAVVGEALELRHRLPRLWARVQACEVEAWRARRIARETITRGLSVEAAGFVDRHLAPVAASIGLPTVERCIDEAVYRWMGDPDPREPDNPVGPDARRFWVDKRQVSFDGTLECHGTLDLADAMAVDDAVREEMERLRALGAREQAGPLSAIALAGLVCRLQDTLPTGTGGLDTAASCLGDHSTTETRSSCLGDHSTTETRSSCLGDHSTTERPARGRRRDRTVLLHLHLSAAAVTGNATLDATVGRVEETRAPVTAEQVRTWCGAGATTHIRVLPVLDLDQRVHVEQYEVPDRIRAQAALSAITCVFPFCERRARGCDTDHVATFDHDAAARGAEQPGPTSSDNAGPLCRSHHRLKTHAPARHRWRPTQLDHGMWLWRSPTGEHYLRDRTGTHPVSSRISGGPAPPG